MRLHVSQHGRRIGVVESVAEIVGKILDYQGKLVLRYALMNEKTDQCAEMAQPSICLRLLREVTVLCNVR